MTVTNDIFLETLWQDTRLVHDLKTPENPDFMKNQERIDSELLKRIWKPESYVVNLISFEGKTL